MNKNISILDCTLRDGGYVNNWEFDNRTASGIIEELQDAGIEFVEVGILGLTKNAEEQVKFNDFSEILPLLKKKNDKCVYTLMLTYSEKDSFQIPACGEDTVQCIRLAFFKPEWKEALKYAEGLKQKGYIVFLQAMATPVYSDEELEALVKEVNDVDPYAFYIVDSFGVLYNRDVLHLVKVVDDILAPGIAFGFHAHNNIQMAFSNSQVFAEYETDRHLIIDAGIYGMGRGAGNLATELIAQYLNKNFGKQYDIGKILNVFDAYIRRIFETYYWGYSMEYFTTSSKNTNSAYGWYLNKKGISKLKDLSGILDYIPDEFRYTLMTKVADEAMEKYGQDDNR